MIPGITPSTRRSVRVRMSMMRALSTWVNRHASCGAARTSRLRTASRTWSMVRRLVGAVGPFDVKFMINREVGVMQPQVVRSDRVDAQAKRFGER